MTDVEKEILKGLLSTIENISNVDFQQKGWIEGKIHPYCFFEETMHQFFDDYEAKEVIDNYKDYGITHTQYKLLSKLYKYLDKYAEAKMSWYDSADPKQILADPKWHKIQKIAKEVLEVFNYFGSRNDHTT